MTRSMSELDLSIRHLQGLSADQLPEPEIHAQHYIRNADGSLLLNQKEFDEVNSKHSVTLAKSGIRLELDITDNEGEWITTLHPMIGASINAENARKKLTDLLKGDGFIDTTDQVKE